MNISHFVPVLFLLSLIFICPGTTAARADVLCSNDRSGTVRIRPEECESNETEVDLTSIELSPEVKPRRWRWLGEGGGTYWYVPKGGLPAVEWDTSDPKIYSPIIDQTIWHIDHYANGYIS